MALVALLAAALLVGGLWMLRMKPPAAPGSPTQTPGARLQGVEESLRRSEELEKRRSEEIMRQSAP